MEILSAHIMFLVIGLFIGLGAGLFLFQCENHLVKYLLYGNGAFGAYLCFDHIYKSFSFSNHKATCFSIFLASIFLGIFLLVVYFNRHFRRTDIGVKIRAGDVLLGKSSFIKSYYESKKRQIDNTLNIEELQKKEQEIQEKELDISRREKEIFEIKKTADDSIKKGVYFLLPINNPIPVSSSFANLLPQHVGNYISFAKVIHQGTIDFIDRYKTKKNDCEFSDYDFLIGYLLQICKYTASYLFNSNNDDVRVHFRFLQGSHYVKLVSSYGSGPYKAALTPIKSYKGMISAAGTHKRSLIKSLNTKHHTKAEHDHIWEDYMTLVFDEFYKNNKPFISMGVSVKCGMSYNDLFYFLNYCKFEQLIQNELKHYNNHICISEILCTEEKKYANN